MTIQTFCPQCGAALAEGAQFCGSCGFRLGGGAPVTSVAATLGQCPHCNTPGQEGVFCANCSCYMPDPTGTVEKVTFNRRFWGTYIVEGILVLVTLIVGWYIWLFFTAKTSQSPAKRLLNVYIIELDKGETISAGRVWVRDVVVKSILFNGILGNITFGIATLLDAAWVLFDPNRQSLHDKMVGTVVVYAPQGLPESLKRPDQRTPPMPVATSS
jgi:uncharacterized RDD family membrane protein YckC